MHLNISTEISDMMRIQYVNLDVENYACFPFHLEGKQRNGG
jgi:hypothetical protein